jgi:hypothetical protein
MKLYSIEINTPYIWSSDDQETRQAQYDQEVKPFLDNEHFEVLPFDDDILRAVEVLTQVWTSEELVELNLAGIQYSKVRLAKDLTGLLETKETKQPAREDYYNERVNVHVPGLALLTYNKTMLLEDCCTHYLQEMLDDGWRIIAVSPQPDQRRPDYILGRYEQ